MIFVVKGVGEKPTPAVTVEANDPQEAFDKANEQSGGELDLATTEIHDAVKGTVYRLKGDDSGRGDEDSEPGNRGEVQ